MAHLDRNLTALAKFQPLLAKALKNAPSIVGHGESAPDGEVTIRTLGSEGAWIHSRRAPRVEAERLIADLKPKYLQTIILSGVGTGLVPRLLLEKFPKRRVLVLESDLSLVRFALEVNDFSKALGDLSLVIGTPVHGEPLSTLLSKTCEDVLVYGHVMLAHRYAAQDERCTPLVADLLAWLKVMQIGLNTAFTNVHTTYSNSLTNLPKYLAGSGTAGLKGCLKGQPAVLVAAGPSLARNIEVLRRYSGRIHTHAVSSALKRVMAAGIEVHSTNVVDYHHLSVRYFDGIENAPPLIAKPTCHPEVLSCYRGPLITSGSPVYERMFGEAAREEIDIDGDSTNVAHHAFLLLAYMGAGPIVLMGLDQANSFHITHSPGTPFFDDLAASSHRFASLEMNELLWITSKFDAAGTDVHGIPLTADPQMTDSAHRFQVYFERMPHVEVINSTEGGRRLAGARDMPLADALSKVVKGNRVSIDDAVAKAMVPKKGAKEAAERDLNRLTSFATKLRDTSRSLLIALEAAHKDLESGKAHRSFQADLDRFNELMGKHPKEFELITAPASSNTFRRKQRRRDAMDDSLSAEERGRMQLSLEHEYMAAIETACQQWIDLTEMTGERRSVRNGAGPRETSGIPPSLGTTRSGAPVAIDAYIQWDEDGAVNQAFLGDAAFSPLTNALRVLCESPHIRRVLLPWPNEMKAPGGHPKLVMLPYAGGLKYPYGDDMRSLYGWNHAGTLRGLSMATTMGAEGHPLAFLEAQSQVADPSPFCLVTTAHTGCLTGEVVDTLVERGRTTQWEQGFYTAEGPRGLVPFIYEREAMLSVHRNNERPHAAFLQMANFWGNSYAYLPSEVVRCRRGFSLTTPRSRKFVGEVAKRLGDIRIAPPKLLDVVAAGEACASDWVGDLPRDLEVELTTDRRVTPTWLPKLGRAGTMTKAQALSLIEQLGDDGVDVNLTLGGHGDALLHPDWDEIVRVAKARCGRVNVRTFGSTLSIEVGVRLRELGVDSLTVRLGVWDRAEFAKHNGVDDFERLVAVMREIVEAGGATGRQVMQLVPEVVKSIEGDRTLLDFRNAWYTPFSWPNLVDYNTWEGAIEGKQGIALYPGVRGPCLRLSEQMLVFAGGEVPLCSQDFDARNPVGNAFETRLRELWRSERFEAARAAHARKDYAAAREACGGCNQWFRLT